MSNSYAKVGPDAPAAGSIWQTDKSRMEASRGRDLKIGQFSVSFIDLDVEANGIRRSPLTPPLARGRLRNEFLRFCK